MAGSNGHDGEARVLAPRKTRAGSIQSVERALAILGRLKDRDELGVSELAAELGLAKTTVHGLVKTLEKHNFLSRGHSNLRYRLGVAAYELGAAFLERMDVVAGARSWAEQLSARFDETVHVAILSSTQAVIVLRVESTRPFSIVPRNSTGVPAHCSAIGKVLLSGLSAERFRELYPHRPLAVFTPNTIADRDLLEQELEGVRLDGFAEDPEEALLGLSCVAAPIRNHAGAVVAAISVAGPVQSVRSPGRREAIVSAVKETAAQISSCLGYRPGAA